MTAEELRHHFNQTFDIDKPWPSTYEVDAETYANVCQHIFGYKAGKPDIYAEVTNFGFFITVAVGKHNGILLAGVELILGVSP